MSTVLSCLSGIDIAVLVLVSMVILVAVFVAGRLYQQRQDELNMSYNQQNDDYRSGW